MPRQRRQTNQFPLNIGALIGGLSEAGVFGEKAQLGKEGALLTKAHDFRVADQTLENAREDTLLTKAHDFKVADEARGNTREDTLLAKAREFKLADEARGNTREDALLIRAHDLRIADEARGNTREDTLLTRARNFKLADQAREDAIVGENMYNVIKSFHGNEDFKNILDLTLQQRGTVGVGQLIRSVGGGGQNFGQFGEALASGTKGFQQAGVLNTDPSLVSNALKAETLTAMAGSQRANTATIREGDFLRPYIEGQNTISYDSPRTLKSLNMKTGQTEETLVPPTKRIPFSSSGAFVPTAKTPIGPPVPPKEPSEESKILQLLQQKYGSQIGLGTSITSPISNLPAIGRMTSDVNKQAFQYAKGSYENIRKKILELLQGTPQETK